MASITYDQACCVYPGADKLAVDRLDLDIEIKEHFITAPPLCCLDLHLFRTVHH